MKHHLATYLLGASRAVGLMLALFVIVVLACFALVIASIGAFVGLVCGALALGAFGLMSLLGVGA